jgi:hypothetical protein
VGGGQAGVASILVPVVGQGAQRGGRTSRTAIQRALLGPPFARRLVLTHAIDDVGDAMVNLSLIGSVFLSVSFDASRGRILQYLVLTAVPLAFVVPVIGPVLDRTRLGYRVGIAGSEFARAALAVLLAGSLDSVAIFPLLFGILFCRKGYAIAKTSLLVGLAPDRQDLLTASGHLARVGSIVGFLGGALGGALYLGFGAAALPIGAAVAYAVAGCISLGIPSPVRTPAASVRGQVGDTPADLWSATAAVSVLRAAGGALTYLLALAVKRGGGDQWVFAGALIAAGTGRFLGTILAVAVLRRREPERILAILLLVPGLVTALGVVTVGDAGIVVIATTLGIASTLATRSIELVQARVPDLARGGVVAKGELRFQLAGVLGAALAVWFAPTPRHGFSVVAVVLVVAALLYISRLGVSLREEFSRLVQGGQAPGTGLVLPAALVQESERLAALGAHRMAIVVADSAVRVVRRRDDVTPANEAIARWDALIPVVDEVMRSDDQPPASVVLTIQQAAREVLASADGSERRSDRTGFAP